MIVIPSMLMSYRRAPQGNRRQDHQPQCIAHKDQDIAGRLAETSDANPVLIPLWSNFQPNVVWLKVRPHFGEGFSGSSEEGCFLGSLAFLAFDFGFSCSFFDSCFFCFFSLQRLFSASMIWMVSRRRVRNSAAAFR